MNRRTAVTFEMSSSYSALPKDLHALLETCNKEEAQHADPCPQLKYSTLWITNDCFDRLCSNPVFWDAMINLIIVSKKNFVFKVKFDALAQSNLSNDNLFSYGLIDSSYDVDNNTIYLSESKYQSGFVLTKTFVDSIPDIKEWITARGIKTSGTFSFAKSSDNLKLEVKEYYNLVEVLDD